MKDMNVICNYIDAVNRADVDELYALMSDDYLFIDAHDNHVYGKDAMRESWTGYFAMFPDYRIEVEEIFMKGSSACLLGYASGTYRGLKDDAGSNYWRIPAAWKVAAANGQVAFWQVFADNIIVMDIINRIDKKI